MSTGTLTASGAATGARRHADDHRAASLDCESLDCTFTAQAAECRRVASNTLTVSQLQLLGRSLSDKDRASWSKLQISTSPELRLLGNQTARVFLERDGGAHRCELIMINNEGLVQTKSLSTQLSLTKKPPCM